MAGHYALVRVTASSLDSVPASRFGHIAGIDPHIAPHLTGTMRTADIITKKLTEALAPQSLKVEDESDQHQGHAGHREGGQTHFRVYIVSPAFKSKTRLERHRMINGILSEELAGGIHALAIHATAPGENETS